MFQEIPHMLSKPMIKITKIAIVALIPLAMVISFCCCKSQESTASIKRIRFNAAFPYVSTEGILENITDTANIYSQGKYIFFTLEHDLPDNPGLQKTKSINFFGKDTGAVFGFYYQSLDTDRGKKMMADSFLTFRNMRDLKQNVSTVPYDSIVSTTYLKDKTTAKQVYITKSNFSSIRQAKYSHLKDTDLSDSVFVSYDKKLLWTPISLSKTLDSMSKSRVYKIVFHFNAQFYKGFDYKFPTRQMVFEMSEQPVDNKERIKAIFQRLKKDYESLPKK